MGLLLLLFTIMQVTISCGLGFAVLMDMCIAGLLIWYLARGRSGYRRFVVAPLLSSASFHDVQQDGRSHQLPDCICREYWSSHDVRPFSHGTIVGFFLMVIFPGRFRLP